MPSSRRARILIADDHALVAEGIANILSAEHEVVGISRDGRALLDDVARLKPDLVCVDMSMPEMNGMQAAVRLKELHPRLKLIFITQNIELPYVKAAFRAGALGYVAKQSASTEVTLAVKKVLLGQRYITPLIAEEQFQPEDFNRAPELVFSDKLTARQREVLQLIAEGRTIREMSESLRISSKTVEFHKNMLMNELGVRTTAELTRYALAHRVVT